MNLHVWAEQLLMGNTLNDKLHFPQTLTDRPHQAWKHPPTRPGRPNSLHISIDTKRPFPRLGGHPTPKEVGLALLYFANHELLAIELMALCLLRFPDAPTGI